MAEEGANGLFEIASLYFLRICLLICLHAYAQPNEENLKRIMANRRLFDWRKRCAALKKAQKADLHRKRNQLPVKPVGDHE